MTSKPTVLGPAPSAPAEVALRDLATADSLLLALDFDGVLAPLQDDPSTSRMVPESASAIAALAGLPRTRVALVSGRDIATLRRLSEAPDSAWLIGSHGAEAELGTDADRNPDTAMGRSPELAPAEAEMLAAIDTHLDAFEHTLPGADECPGSAAATTGAAATTVSAATIGASDSGHADGPSDFLIERKPYSRTVHTRGLAPEAAAALHEHALDVVEEFPDIRVIEGHDITELAVKQATKGDGIRLLARAGEPTAMGYLGDDVTDEDAFAALDELTDSRALNAGLTVKVGSAPTRASWRIADPAAVAELLGRLVAERTEFLRTVHD